MNWIQGIQRAIDYVEANITEEIDFEEVAKQSYSSSFHFQRVFGILCGFSLGDYIRMRRLSLAGEELSKGNAKIIDIAMKYGYDTSESFSRAFARFHGIAPSEAKHGGKAKIFTPLSVKLTLTGGSKMDYRI
ncbi:MAG: helix-turn-helix domain-containing protein, partial [Eubacterium sp.]